MARVIPIKEQDADLVQEIYPLEKIAISGFTADGGATDAFARLRISEPFTLFDSKQIWNDSDLADSVENFPLFWDNQETSGGGTSTLFQVNRASTTLSVSNTTAGTRQRQTKQRFNYQPGKSQLVILTGLMTDEGAGITKRYGLYDDDNGLFLQVADGVLGLGVRSFVSGAAVDTIATQANWNLDTMDGAGPSGVTLDLGKVQIFFLDFEWLGIGRARFGFFIDGSPIYCHENLVTNVQTSVYMSTPNLPIRAEIINDGAGGIASFEIICCTVISEGGLNPNGAYRFADIGTEAADDITAGTRGTAYAVCGLRLKTNYLSAEVREAFISIIENSGANNPFLWKLHLNPTLTVGLTYADVSRSALQFGSGLPAGDALTDEGIVLAGGYQARQDANANTALKAALRMGSLIDGTRDEMVVSATPITTNQLFYGGIQWLEIW